MRGDEVPLSERHDKDGTPDSLAPDKNRPPLIRRGAVAAEAFPVMLSEPPAMAAKASAGERKTLIGTLTRPVRS